jgi:transposase InsO family protein
MRIELPSLHAPLRVEGSEASKARSRGRGWGVYRLAPLAESLLRHPPPPTPDQVRGRLPPRRFADRGVQYASADYRKAMQSAGLEASMSRKADGYDDAPMESLFHTLKTELVHHRQYATRAEATLDIFACIEGFCNRTRRHPAIGYISPVEMELKAA